MWTLRETALCPRVVPASMRGLSQKWLHQHQSNLLPRANLRQDRLVAGDGPRHGPGLGPRLPGALLLLRSARRRIPVVMCPAPLVALPGGPGSYTQATTADPQLAACSTAVETSVTTPVDKGDLTLGGGGTPSAPPRRSGNIRDPPPGVRRPPSPRTRPPRTASRSPCAKPSKAHRCSAGAHCPCPQGKSAPRPGSRRFSGAAGTAKIQAERAKRTQQHSRSQNPGQYAPNAGQNNIGLWACGAHSKQDITLGRMSSLGPT